MNSGFNAPIRANAVDPSRVLFGCFNGIYESLDQGDTVSQISTSLVVNDDVDHVAMVYGGVIGGVENPDLIIVGSGNELWTRTAPAPAPFARNSAYPGSLNVNGLAVDPSNAKTICTADDEKIFCSVNGGAWVDQTGGLAGSGPFNTVSIGTARGSSNLIVGSNAGVFISALSSLGTWNQVGTGLPNAIVTDVAIDSAADSLMAGTLGRGAWLISLGGPTPTPTATPTATPTGAPTPGAQASSSPANSSGRSGATVGGGSVTIANTSKGPESISAVTVSVSRPGLFSQLVLTGGGQTVTISPVASSVTFAFNPPIAVASGNSATFTLSATLAGSTASSPMNHAGFGVTPHWIGRQIAAGTMPMAALLLMGLALAMRSAADCRRRALPILIAIGLCATAIGCGGNDSSPPPPSSTQSVTAAKVSNAGGTVTVGGLPGNLGTITKI